jgi:hypothetical protein
MCNIAIFAWWCFFFLTKPTRARVLLLLLLLLLLCRSVVRQSNGPARARVGRSSVGRQAVSQ